MLSQDVFEPLSANPLELPPPQPAFVGCVRKKASKVEQ
jgi:hypothetical protein